MAWWQPLVGLLVVAIVILIIWLIARFGFKSGSSGAPNEPISGTSSGGDGSSGSGSISGNSNSGS